MDPLENTNGYYFWEHAALKCIANFHGQYKTLNEMFTAFKNNSLNGYSKDWNKDGKNVN